MEYRYVVEENGIRKLNLGTYTINITNTKEEFWADYRYERSQKLEHYVKQPFTELDYNLTSDKNYIIQMFFGVNTGEIQPYCGEGI